MGRTGKRSSAIILKEGKILLIHRKKEGGEYSDTLGVIGYNA